LLLNLQNQLNLVKEGTKKESPRAGKASSRSFTTKSCFKIRRKTCTRCSQFRGGSILQQSTWWHDTQHKRLICHYAVCRSARILGGRCLE